MFTPTTGRMLRLFLLASASAILVLLDGGGTSASPGTTERVSVDSAGNQANGRSYSEPAISPDGRYVAFSSEASDLVPGDTNNADDVFVHDRQTGETARVSVDSLGNQGNGQSRGPTISADGRYVAFDSGASNLVPGCSCGYGCAHVFVHDRQTGQTTCVSVDSFGNGGDWWSSRPAISADGRYVAFESVASNLVEGDTNGTGDIFVHDRQTGETARVSVDSLGNQGNSYSSWPAISADGRYVAFDSGASNLVPEDTNDSWDVFVHDRQTGVTERVSVDSLGNQGNSVSQWPDISADGRYAAFFSHASNLVPADTNASRDVFVHDRQTGATERVSVDSLGNQGNLESTNSAINADGRYVAFDSGATNLVPGDTNGGYDVFVHDRQTGETGRVSVDSAGNQANNYSYGLAISADGRYVGFASNASNLVPGDTNGVGDVFVHDRCPDGSCGGPAPTPTPPPSPVTDLSGEWDVTAAATQGPDAGLTNSCDLNVTQSGTQVTGNMSCVGAGSGPISGVFNESTMQITFTWTRPGLTMNVSATLSGDGNSQSGTWWASNGDRGTYTASRAAPPPPTSTPTATPVPDTAPIAAFNCTPDEPLPKETFLCDGSASTDEDGQVVAYSWKFLCIPRDGDPLEWTLDGSIAPASLDSDGYCLVELTVTDDDGQTNKLGKGVNVHGFSFAVINDLHLGAGGQPIDGNFPIERLRAVVRWINENHAERDIDFVVVLGDISDDGDKSVLEKAKTELEKLDVPFIPVMGNHDLHFGDTRKNFAEVFPDQFKDLNGRWGVSDLDPDCGGSSSLQNFSFSYRGVRFIGLDFLDLLFRSSSWADVEFHPQTVECLKSALSRGTSSAPVVILAHHPFLTPDECVAKFGGLIPAFDQEFCRAMTFSKKQIATLRTSIESLGRGRFVTEFGGHLHGFPKFMGLRRVGAAKVPVFNANKELSRATVGADVVITEALKNGANEVDKGFVRIVKVDAKGVDYTTLIDDFPPALNPDMDCTVKKVAFIGRQIWCTGDKYTDRQISSWKWDFNGDGSIEAEGQKPKSYFYAGAAVGKEEVCLWVTGEGAQEKVCKRY